MTSAKRWLNCLHMSQLALSFDLYYPARCRKAEGWQEETTASWALKLEKSKGGGYMLFLVPQ